MKVISVTVDELPVSCEACPFISVRERNPIYTWNCFILLALKGNMREIYVPDDGRLDDCPLVEQKPDEE